jgi:deoxycytidylate deaminase
MIINSGIVEVVYNLDYALNESSFRLFSEAGIAIRRLKLD